MTQELTLRTKSRRIIKKPKYDSEEGSDAASTSINKNLKPDSSRCTGRKEEENDYVNEQVHDSSSNTKPRVRKSKKEYYSDEEEIKRGKKGTVNGKEDVERYQSLLSCLLEQPLNAVQIDGWKYFFPEPMACNLQSNLSLLLLGVFQTDKLNNPTTPMKMITKVQRLVSLELQIARWDSLRTKEIEWDNGWPTEDQWREPVAAIQRFKCQFHHGEGGFKVDANKMIIGHPFESIPCSKWIKREHSILNVMTEDGRLVKTLPSFPTLHNVVKIYCLKEELYVYLDTEKFFILFKENLLDYSVLQKIKNLATLTWEKLLNEPTTIKDTFDEPESDPSEGFKLNLFDYQKRTLGWMVNLENDIKLRTFKQKDIGPFIVFPNPNYIYSVFDCMWLKCNSSIDYYLNKDRFISHGGILADKPGAGKTVTMLSLIHSNPLKSINEIKWQTEIMHTKYVPSYATLVVCPSNLAQQWGTELKKCLGNSKRCIRLCTITDHSQVSYRDIMTADIVIVSVAFFSNNNYLKTLIDSKTLNKEIIASMYWNLGEISQEKGIVDLSGVYFHRIVFDEFHELKNRQGFKNIYGSFYWGLTGTPKPLTGSAIDAIISLLHVKVYDSDSSLENGMFRYKFEQICMRRNEPELNLPTMNSSIVWVTQTNQEIALTMSLYTHSVQEKIMMCCHHQLTDTVVSQVGETAKSVDDVADMIQFSRKKSYSKLLIEKSIKEDEFCSISIKIKSSKDIGDDDERKEFLDELYKERGILSARMSEIDSGISRLEKELEYFGRLLSIIREEKEETCSICLDIISFKSGISITKCGHIFCQGCIQATLQLISGKKCPMCRTVLEGPRCIISFSSVTQEEENQDTAIYGSKIKALLKYINDQINHRKSNGMNPPKIILFAQFRRLAILIVEALKKLGLELYQLQGSVLSRNKAIDGFKSSNESTVLMMSAEDSVSGLNLTVATDILIIHPFYYGYDDHAAIAAEKQGIARAYRMGLEHPLNVVRFVTKDSIEDEITRGRVE